MEKRWSEVCYSAALQLTLLLKGSQQEEERRVFLRQTKLPFLVSRKLLVFACNDRREGRESLCVNKTGSAFCLHFPFSFRQHHDDCCCLFRSSLPSQKKLTTEIFSFPFRVFLNPLLCTCIFLSLGPLPLYNPSSTTGSASSPLPLLFSSRHENIGPSPLPVHTGCFPAIWPA